MLAFIGTNIYDNISTRSSLRFSTQFAGEFVSNQTGTGEYIQQWHDPSFVLKYLKYKPAVPLFEDVSNEGEGKGEGEGKEFMVPEQEGLPMMKKLGKKVTQISEEERWKLVKGLRRLSERMPQRWAAT